MVVVDGGDYANVANVGFRCPKCGATANLTLTNDDGLHFWKKDMD